MYKQDKKTTKSDVSVADKEEIVISSFDANNQDRNSDEDLINSDSKILFCPDCGEQETN